MKHVAHRYGPPPEVSVYLYVSICLQHANAENPMFGIDGNTGEITDMKELGVSRLTRFLFL